MGQFIIKYNYIMAVFLRLGQLVLMTTIVFIALYFGLQTEPPLLNEIWDEIQKMDSLDCVDGGSGAVKIEC